MWSMCDVSNALAAVSVVGIGADSRLRCVVHQLILTSVWILSVTAVAMVTDASATAFIIVRIILILLLLLIL